MSKELFKLIRSLRGQGYTLYCALRQSLGAPPLQAFYTWWRLIPPASRKRIKRAWRFHINAKGVSAYWMFRSLQEKGTISRTDFNYWWDMIPSMPRTRILLCWWAFLQQGCHAVHITKARGISEAIIAIRLTPGVPITMYF